MFGNSKETLTFAGMIAEELTQIIGRELRHTPTTDQAHAMSTFCRFLTDRSPWAAMILRGSAGTGKTTLASAMVKALAAMNQKMVLLAPTGRAAKVFSLYAGHPAYTIHRRIYRQKTAGDLSAFSLNDNLHTHTLFIVDEASMIANGGASSASFGSGCLLDDLIQYVYGSHEGKPTDCRLLIIGDSAQLPPVGEQESAALSGETLRGYGLTVYECDLKEVLRQSQDSGILFNATLIRQLITHDEMTQLPKIKLGFPDIVAVNGNELIDSLSMSYSKVGLDDTIVVTRSNKRANIYNRGIRGMVLDREEKLCRNDQIMIVKNNYYWAEEERKHQEGQSAPPFAFLANGDRAIVQRIRNERQLYGFLFANATLRLPDYDDYELTATVLLDTLDSESPALTREQQESLYNSVMEDYGDIAQKADRLKQLRQDAHYNALQIKYAYAVTCHKAQGGQWAHVYIDQGYMTDDMLTPDYIHWLYTAFTRATEKLFLVNWPKEQTSADRP
jgi:ATP-dependent exoDNAse (exonuclease V) alpha subunit